MEILTLLSATDTAHEPYGNVIITIIGISYIFKLILEITKKNEPKHKKLIESIETINLAIFDSFWQDIPNFQDDDEKKNIETIAQTFNAFIVFNLKLKEERDKRG